MSVIPTKDAAHDRTFILLASAPALLVGNAVLDLAFQGGEMMSLADALEPGPLLWLMAIDSMDPYDYNQALNQKIVQHFFGKMLDTMKQAFQDVEGNILAGLARNYPDDPSKGWDQAFRNRMVKYFASPYRWSAVTVCSNDDGTLRSDCTLTDCFPGLTKQIGPAAVGPPQPGCDPQYLKDYWAYFNAHKDTVEKAFGDRPSFSSSDLDTLGIAQSSLTLQHQVELKEDGENYWIVLGAVLLVPIVVLMVLLVLHFVFRK